METYYLKKALFFKHWSKSNIVTINDVWNENENKWIQGQNIHDQLTCKRNWIF